MAFEFDWSRVAQVATTVLALSTTSTLAQTQDRHPAVQAQSAVPRAQSDTVEELVRRLSVLEQKLKDIEAEKSAKVAPTAEAAGTGQATPGTAPSLPPQALPPQALPPGMALPTAAQSLSPSGYPVVTPAEATKAAEEAARREEKAREKGGGPAKTGVQGTDLAASLLLRETAATLTAKQVEVTQDVSYTRNEGFLQHDRAVTSISGIRYGVFAGVELGLSIPVYWSRRSTQSLNTLIVEDVRDLGDVSASATATLWHPASWYPGAAFTGSVVAPTSARSPYAPLDNYVVGTGSDPRYPLRGTQAQGHWASSGLLQFYKTFDPLVLTAGIGIQYTFAKDVDDFTVQPGVRYNYNIGMSFAVSEFTTLGFQVIGGVQLPIMVNGAKSSLGWSEQHRARFSLAQRLMTDLYVEPSIAIGLSESSPDFMASLGARYRF